MTKTTFLGYVPSLKSKHEATIVNGRAMKSKGGSIRYLLEGEYNGRKTLPKTVSKEDFVKVYGFDAKEAESVVVGNPSPADVEPPAPSEKPFPQEPSNENFSAEERYDFITLKESGNKLIITLNEGADIEGYDEYEIFEDVSANSRWKLGEAYEIGGLSEAPVIFEIGYEGDDDDDDDELPFYAVGTPYYYLNYQVSDWKEKLLDEGEVIFEGIEVKEALGLFGKKDEEEKEESDEPKTQEFTVVLQEGDKLELTDIPEEKEEEVSEEKEEQEALPEDENEEKGEETAEIEEKAAENVRVFVVSSVDYETDGEDQDELGLPQDFTFALDIDDIGDTTDMQEIADEIVDDISDETGFLVSGFYFQERMPDGTLVDLDAETYEAVQAKVTRPVKEETEDEKEESEEGLSTGAKVALGVGALAVGAAIFGAEGEYPQEFLDEFYDFDSNPTADTQDEETIAIAYAAWLEGKKNEDDYIPYESETDYSRIYGATSGEGYINHDPIYQDEDRRVEIKYDDPTTYYDWNSQDEVEEDEVEEAIKEELGNEPGTGAYGATLEVRSALNPDKYVDVDVDMDTDYNEGRFMGMAAEHESESDGYTYAYTKGHKDGMDNEIIYRPSIETDREKTIFKKILKQKADTVGNPSPSGPSSTPEPAEATGSEPSNEEFKSDNSKMALGLLGIGIGAVALLGGDRIKKLFDRFG